MSEIQSLVVGFGVGVIVTSIMFAFMISWFVRKNFKNMQEYLNSLPCPYEDCEECSDKCDGYSAEEYAKIKKVAKKDWK